MSFKSYAITTLDDDSIELADPQPLVFSGHHGLIARFVRAEPKRAIDPWKLCPGELHALAFPEGFTGERAIVFEETTETTLEIQWLQSIHGQSAARTEMLFSFTPLRIESARLPLRVRPPTVSRTYAEELVLEGGVLSPQGTWRWCKPHLNLGGVVLQRQPTLAGRPL
ncbi:hypothetical protein Ga0100231_025055 [Opitutaceae bacterium TAV4]|uniref:hypothetical protein n=1 Tax=Geminisphaera colitermitum TaxID=1148786 RepID=UPI000158CAA5|nr:hypothetical protein [Geminisphaera colitermitum]RRJ97012.1 hypothetical protein Ga0100231_025055 [Opitutaceae bacterium TAV4]RRK00991.1 hypothetical protein Ga0100230_024860 [Opitutaceae bacterium TAV3]